MKVLNIMTSKVLGGIEQAFLDYNDAFVSMSFDVFNIVHKKTKVAKNINKNVKQIHKINFFRPYIFNYFKIKNIIKELAPDVIVTHSKKTAAVFYKVAKALNIPVVLVLHNSKIKNIAGADADAIFSVTQYQKNLLVESGIKDSKIIVIPNFITKFKEFEPQSSYKSPPVIGAVGRIDPAKDFTTLILALAKLNKKGVDFKAKIAGSATPEYKEEEDKIKTMIKNNRLEGKVKLVGWVDDKEKFFNSIDVFVLPSKYESFGIVLLEAMVNSKPIITSKANGPLEIFNKSGACLQFGISNYEALATHLENLFENYELAMHLAKEGHNLLKNKYTLQAVAPQLKSAIENVIINHKKQ